MIISLTNCYRKKKIGRGLALKNFERVGKTNFHSNSLINKYK